MSYKLETTNWKFTVPQAGEVDSVENFAKNIQEIDDALIDPGVKAQLMSRGEAQPIVGQDGEFRDDTFHYDEYTGKFVTETHAHPTPDSVPNADHADEADHAFEADHAKIASRLEPGAHINGYLFDGTQDITLKTDDIPDANRVFYGTVKPAQFGGFPKVLRNGDLYVEYTN